MDLADLYEWPATSSTWTPSSDDTIVYQYTGRDSPGTWTVYLKTPDGEKLEQASFTMFGFGPAAHHDSRERFEVVAVGDGEFTVHPPFGTRFDLVPQRSDTERSPDWSEHATQYRDRVTSQFPEDISDESAAYEHDHELDNGFEVVISVRNISRGKLLNVDLVHPAFSRPIPIGQDVTAPTTHGHTDGYYRALPSESAADEPPALTIAIPGLGEQHFEYLPEFTVALRKQ